MFNKTSQLCAVHHLGGRFRQTGSFCITDPELPSPLLQGLQEFNSDTFDDWRDLLEEQERRMRDELDASKVWHHASSY